MKHVQLILWSITASLAGFLFGFDTIVISGAEQQIQSVWRLSNLMHGICISSALWGTVLGSLIGGWPTEKFGRRKTLLLIGLLYFVSAVGSAIAPEVYSFVLARFIGGLGVGIATVAAPLYISEISPAGMRGRLTGMFQFNIVFGILVAFLSNYLISNFMDSQVAWRWMLGVEALPALVYSLMCFSIPESPRWLIVHGGKYEEGLQVFRQINQSMSNSELTELADSVAASGSETGANERFFSNRLRTPILLAFLVAFFNQMSGINAILYFAPRILGLAGLTNPLLAAALLGLTNLVFTYVGLWLIDKIGRRSLLLIGSVGYIISLGVCAFAFLSYPGFRVVSASIDVTNAVEQMDRLDQADSPLTPGEQQSIRDKYDSTKKSLLQASNQKYYKGDPVTIPASADLIEVERIAIEAKEEASELLGPLSALVLTCIMAFIASHAIGQGTVIWVLISEIFPNSHRATGQAFGSFTHWICAALITLVFPFAIESFDAGIVFAFFCFMMVLHLLWALTMVPETKGISLEELQNRL